MRAYEYLYTFYNREIISIS